MLRLLKLLAILASTLLGLVLVALIVVLSISDERYKQWTIEAVESTTGRQLAMDDFVLDLGEVISLEASNVRFANAPWAASDEMVRVERLELVVHLFDLLRGRPAVEARIGGAALDLERNASGGANWRMAGESAGERDTRDNGGVRAVALVRELLVEDTQLTLDDAVSGTVRSLTIDTLSVRSGETVDVTLAARAQDVPLALSGTLGRADQLVEAQSTSVQLSGTAGDAALDVSGTWNPVLQVPEADIRIALDMPSDAAIVALTGLDAGAVGSGRIEAHFVADRGGYALPALDVRLDGERIAAEISGAIGRLSPPGDVDLTVDVRTSEPAALLRQLGVNVASPLPAAITLRGRLEGDGQTIRVSEVAIATGEGGLTASAFGTVAFADDTVPDLDITFEANAPSSAALSTYAGQSLPALGALRARGKVVTIDDAVGLEQLAVDLGGRGIDVHVEGAVADLAGFAGADLRVTATMADLDTDTIDALATLANDRGIKLPSALLAARAEAKGRIQGGAGKLDLREWTTAIRDQGMAVDLSGSIEDLLGERIIAAEVSGNVDSLAALTRFTGTALPAIGSLRATGKVATTDAGIGLEQLVVDLGGRGLELHVEGTVANLVRLAGADLRASASIADLDDDAIDALAALANERGVQIPPALFAARADVKGRVQGGIEKLSINELSAALRDDGVTVDVSGEVDDLLGEPAVRAEGSAKVDSLDILARYTGNDLPATDPVTLRASLGGGADGGTPFNLDIATGAIEATVEGDLGAIRALDDMQLAFTATAASLADFSTLAQRELPANGPFLLSGRFEASGSAYALNDFTLKIDDQEAAGTLTVTPGSAEGAIGTVDGRLAIGRLDLGPLVGLREEGEAPDSAPAGLEARTRSDDAGEREDSAPRRLFSAEPLPFDLLRNYEGNVSITARHMSLGKTNFSNLETVVSLQGGRLAIEPLTSYVDNGALTGRVLVNAASGPARASVYLDMKGAAMPRLGGNLEMGLDVQGEGNSIAEIMAVLDGQVLVVVNGAQVESSLLTSFGSDLLGSLNPLSKSKRHTELECGILRMDIKDGIARFDDHLAAQLTETTWRGGGEINLQTEALDVGIVPKARKGLGISAGSLASLVQVTGTLAQPAVRPDPKGLVKNYSRYFAAVSTGGLSLLAEGLRDRFQANADVCAQIRKGSEFGSPANAATPGGG